MTLPTTPPGPSPQDGAQPPRRPRDWAHTARFLTTAARLDQLPRSALPEVAFVGRSNAGKSTAINTLAQQRRLAFASKTPGRTQHINLFALGPKEAPDALLADLPGYGYAAVERQAKLRWQQVMADYLAKRDNLTGVVLLVDPRLGLTDLDQRLLDFVRPRVATGAVKLLVVLTKADKLNRTEARKALAQAEQALAEHATEDTDMGLMLFSALKREGIDDLAETLRAWVDAAPPPPVDEVLADEAAGGAEAAQPADGPAPSAEDGPADAADSAAAPTPQG